jgi:hypothetical protein
MDAKKTMDSLFKRLPVLPEVQQGREMYQGPQPQEPSSVMLDVRLADGRVVSLSYAYFVEMEYRPGDVLLLRFGRSTVQIEGRRLNKLRDMLADHRVRYVQEGTEAEDGLKPEAAPHIDKIVVELNPEEGT